MRINVYYLNCHTNGMANGMLKCQLKSGYRQVIDMVIHILSQVNLSNPLSGIALDYFILTMVIDYSYFIKYNMIEININ